MAAFDTLTDYEICQGCDAEREKPRSTTASAAASFCHELLCRAFIGHSDEALAHVYDTYSAEFSYWVTSHSAYQQLQACTEVYEPPDIVQDVIVKLFFRPEKPILDCYEHFPVLGGMFFFIKRSLQNHTIDLVKKCRFTAVLGIDIPFIPDGDPELMRQIDERIREILPAEEDMVYRFWIYGLPSREEVLAQLGNRTSNPTDRSHRQSAEDRLNAIKKRIRNVIRRDKIILRLLNFPVDPDDQTP